MQTIIAWLIGTASPSKAGVQFSEKKCQIVGCSFKAPYTGKHYLLGWVVDVCWFHQYTIRPTSKK